ncbi:MAG: tetratricopeptide repeat protein [Planctomycetes bacterium]|nr:tetratricopeptide repeat protein [Planctomycetota bacterium]MCH9724073.1 tetratricopeptide repeat protein [Planctomycetota bacterium]MCH9778129.1 tetratricopeptide repeat protein [Planctomycetota bacterium]MDF1745166.1 tetratricopeptide repeat protein [Gimesia sp.]
MTSDRNKKIAADCWRRGNEALAKENWDYSIEMFTTAVKLDPAALLYRQTKRGAERKKYGDNSSGSKMGVLKLAGSKTKIKNSRRKKDWVAVDQTAEESLSINPWDSSLNADMAEACQNQGYLDAAVFGYKMAIENDKTNKSYYTQLGILLEEKGEFKQARECWEMAFKLDPMDGEARSKVTALMATETRVRGGYEGADKSSNVKHQSAYDEGRATREERHKAQKGNAPDGPGQSQEADLQRSIRKEPENKDHYLRLADFYRRDGKLVEAKELYEKAYELSGKNANIGEQIEDVELELLRERLGEAKDLYNRDRENAEAKKQVTLISKALIKREIEIFTKRVESYPADMRLKFELAQRFIRLKKWGPAISLLQQSVKDTRISADALVALGKCFFADGKKELAKRQFEKALPNLSPDEKPNIYKEAHYLLARLYEESKEREKAEDHYSEILAVDYDYRDTLKRLEDLGGGSSDSNNDNDELDEDLDDDE